MDNNNNNESIAPASFERGDAIKPLNFEPLSGIKSTTLGLVMVVSASVRNIMGRLVERLFLSGSMANPSITLLKPNGVSGVNTATLPPDSNEIVPLFSTLSSVTKKPSNKRGSGGLLKTK